MTSSLVKMLGGIAVAASATGAVFGQGVPAGQGCEFGLIFEPLEEGHQFVRLDRLEADHGRTGVLIVAGQFGRLQVSNESTGESLVLPGRGANLKVVNNPDGTQTLNVSLDIGSSPGSLLTRQQDLRPSNMSVDLLY